MTSSKEGCRTAYRDRISDIAKQSNPAAEPVANERVAAPSESEESGLSSDPLSPGEVGVADGVDDEVTDVLKPDVEGGSGMLIDTSLVGPECGAELKVFVTVASGRGESKDPCMPSMRNQGEKASQLVPFSLDSVEEKPM